jgi:hypothetical protein
LKVPEPAKKLDDEQPADAETPRAFGMANAASASAREAFRPVARAVRFHIFSGTSIAVEKDVAASVIDAAWDVPGLAAIRAASDGQGQLCHWKTHEPVLF